MYPYIHISNIYIYIYMCVNKFLYIRPWVMLLKIKFYTFFKNEEHFNHLIIEKKRV